MKKLNVITSNQGKYEEYKDMLADSFSVSMKKVHYHEIQTDRLKDVVVHALDDLVDHAPLIIDDSGLFIDALNDFPGVYSAYVMRTLGCGGILKLLEGEKDRGARFECMIGLLEEDKKIFKGVCKGSISHEIRGEHGFGYDPIFVPSGYDITFAEMKTDQKNELSHRGKAMKQLLEYTLS